VGRARVLCSRLGFRVTERAHNILFESGPHGVIGHGHAGREAPRIIGKLLSGCGLNKRVTRHCARQHAAKKRTPIEQAIARNRRQIFQFSLGSITWCHGHDCPPRVTVESEE